MYSKSFYLRSIGLLLLILVLSLSQQIDSQNQSKVFTTTIPLGGNVYQITGKEQETIDENGICSWKENETEFAVYFSSMVSTKVTLHLDLQKQAENGSILVDAAGQTKSLRLKKGTVGQVLVGTVSLKKGYNVVRLKGIRKKGENFAKISNIVLEQVEKTAFNYVKDNVDGRYYWGKRGPSVHLSYSLPKDRIIKWFYNEVTVPEGEDPVGSYYMANGFGQGYFGIQVNSKSERRVLFSVWSPFNTDNPKAIPENKKIKLLKKGEGVQTGEFGNEGSGGQSYLRYKWKTGKTCKFLNSIEPDNKGNTLYTAYFWDDATSKWLLIASFLRPETTTWYNQPYSFLENFSSSNGYLERKVYFSNQWVCDTNGQWIELDASRLSGDDIANRNFRLDFEGGVEKSLFYLKNGGFFNGNSKLLTEFKRQVSNIKPLVNFNTLP